MLNSFTAPARSGELLIDDFANKDLKSALGSVWRGVSDLVMGGVSEAAIKKATVDGRVGLRLSGYVRLENNGGFIQAALDLNSGGGLFDASAYTGVRLTVRGNGETYNLHLRTADNTRPWQSYRVSFVAPERWTTIELPFANFTPHRLAAPLDTTVLKRIGIVAIGRAFYADLTLTDLRLYR